MDLTFSNNLIKGFFDGSDDYIPSKELVYLHEHPLIKESFLVQLESMINQTTEVLIKKNIKGVVLDRFIDATIKLGEELPIITLENSPKILNQLRIVYTLCKQLLK